MIILAPASAPQNPPLVKDELALFQKQSRVFNYNIYCCVDEGFYFPFSDDYSLPQLPPADLSKVKCILIDPRRQKELESGPHWKRLEAFVRRGGLIMHPALDVNVGGPLGDQMARHYILRMQTSAGLTGRHTQMIRRLAEKEEPSMVELWKKAAPEELAQYVRMGNPFGDPATRVTCWAAAEAAEFFKDPTLADPVWAFMQSQHPHLEEHLHCYGGFAVKLFERTGERALLDPIIKHFKAKPRWRLHGVELNCDVRAPADADPDQLPELIAQNAWTWPETADFLCEVFPLLSRALNDPSYLDRAIKHVLTAHTWLFAPEISLWYHIGRPNGPDRRSAPWGRGNAWFLYALRDLLETMPADHPKRDEVIGLMRLGLEGLLKTQDKYGLWYNVLDAREGESRQCASATSRYIHIFARAYWKGWIRDPRIPEMVERAWKGLKTKIWNYHLIAYCVGTSHMLTRQGYLSRPHDTFRVSRSSLLLAWMEAQRMRRV